MTSYHSEFTESPKTVGNMALLPLKTRCRGPAPQMMDLEKDIIDEALFYFKPLVFFRNYEIKSEADRVLVYLVLYIIECLKKLQKCANRTAGSKELTSLGIARFELPGEPGFPLSAWYAAPRGGEETETMRSYIQQLRQETGLRLLDRVFTKDNEPPSKWWMCFARKKFLDKSLSAPGRF